MTYLTSCDQNGMDVVSVVREVPFSLIVSLADPRGGARDARPPWGSKFFHFHAVFGKKLKNNSTFGSWRPPPWGKSGSATEFVR